MQLFEELIVKVKAVEIQSFKAWLYTCIRNNCLMEIRKKSKNLSISLDDSFMEFCDDFHLTFVNEKENREKSLRECVEGLPERQRVSVKYFFLDELSYKEVEERTGFSSKMVKSFIQNGKRNLKLCLQRKGIKLLTRPQHTSIPASVYEKNGLVRLTGVPNESSHQSGLRELKSTLPTLRTRTDRTTPPAPYG